MSVHSIVLNPVDFINSPVYRGGCEFSGIFPKNPVGLAGMHTVDAQSPINAQTRSTLKY